MAKKEKEVQMDTKSDADMPPVAETAAPAPAPAPAKGKTEIETVTMSDGRQVAFPGKRKMLKEGIEEADGTLTVRIDFRNGVTKTHTLNKNLMAQYALHGALQKLGDEAAGVEEIDDMVVAIEAISDRLDKGEWGAARAAGDGFNGASIVIRALMEASSKTADQVKAFLQGKIDAAKAKGETLTRNELYASFRNPATKVGQIVARMEQEKLAKNSKVDADALLNELG